MTVDHDSFQEAIAEIDDLEQLPDELAAHVDECDACDRRLALMRRLRATALQSGIAAHALDSTDIDVTAAVLDATHGHRGGRPRLLLAVAAAAVLAVGGGVIVADRFGQPAGDVLADIATELQASEGTRFVLATEATVDLADEFDFDGRVGTEVEPLSDQIPRCAGDESTPTPSTGLDLGPIVDALTSDDPCDVLALIDANVAQPVADSYVALSSSINSTSQQLAALSAVDADSPLAAASADVYRERREQELSAAQTALDDLRRSFTSLNATLAPVAASGEFQSVRPGLVGDQLAALQARVDTADAAVIADDATVTWSQIATGSWTPDEVLVSGTSEQGDITIGFDTIEEDPLGLSSALLGSPQHLIAILESAPSSTSQEIEWEIPAELIEGPERWTAVVRQTDGQLDELILRSRNTTITMTLAR